MGKKCRSVSEIADKAIINSYEEQYKIEFPKEMIDFFDENNGGIPLKKEIVVDGEEYEIRCFLSFNDNEYNSIKKSLETFQNNTKGKIIPIAKDSGDNYFCLNVENKKVYYWDHEDNKYYRLAESFNEFISLIDCKQK